LVLVASPNASIQTRTLREQYPPIQTKKSGYTKTLARFASSKLFPDPSEPFITISVDPHLAFTIQSRCLKAFGKIILEMRVACNTAIRMNNVSFRTGNVQKVLNRE
jgi:hypothetical protein